MTARETVKRPKTTWKARRAQIRVQSSRHSDQCVRHVNEASVRTSRPAHTPNGCLIENYHPQSPAQTGNLQSYKIQWAGFCFKSLNFGIICFTDHENRQSYIMCILIKDQDAIMTRESNLCVPSSLLLQLAICRKYRGE